jgi:hypothetical protein
VSNDDWVGLPALPATPFYDKLLDGVAAGDREVELPQNIEEYIEAICTLPGLADAPADQIEHLARYAATRERLAYEAGLRAGMEVQRAKIMGRSLAGLVKLADSIDEPDPDNESPEDFLRRLETLANSGLDRPEPDRRAGDGVEG